jgi:transposase InsO family protein
MDHPNRIWDLIFEVRAIVLETKERTGWKASMILRALDASPSTYYRVLRKKGLKMAPRRKNTFEVLQEERDAVLKYVREHPNPRHRELAWMMIDEGVVFLSASTIYRIMEEEGLVPPWPKETTDEQQGSGPRREWATEPDAIWEVDFTYIHVEGKWRFLMIVIDEYSRYIVHWALSRFMDANVVTLELEKALAIPGRTRDPILQTDNGPAFISREFKRYLSFVGIGHMRIHPYSPKENALVERGIKTVKELAGDSFDGQLQAEQVIKENIDHYNNVRLHSSLHYLRPINYYRGNHIEMLEVRREKLAFARERRKQINLGLRQTTLCPEEVSS